MSSSFLIRQKRSLDTKERRNWQYSPSFLWIKLIKMSRTELIKLLFSIYKEALQAEQTYHSLIDSAHSDNRLSASNLIHYLVLRRYDLRQIQDALSDWGISSLGRSESCVLWSLEKVLEALGQEVPSRPYPLSRQEGAALLVRNKQRLLGESHLGSPCSIMVTLPTEAAENPKLIEELLRAGMNVVRINCGHDNPEVWSKMIENSRKASSQLGYSCKILMDLPGPKLRIVSLDPAIKACAIRPKRDLLGKIVDPGWVWIGSEEQRTDPPIKANSFLRFPREWVEVLKEGDTIRFFDARGKGRTLKIDQQIEKGWLAHSIETAYLKEGIVFVHLPHSPEQPQRAAVLKSLSPQQPFLLVRNKDRLWICKDNGLFNHKEEVVGFLRISHPQILADIKAEEQIWFDDGKVGGKVIHSDSRGILVEITHVQPNGYKLRVDRGINLPFSDLKISALTEQDIRSLSFVVKHADAVGISFLRLPSDIDDLDQALSKESISELGIVLKIETRKGFENLPLILLKAMKYRSIGVMIARGDLAVECGYERLAEVQEEILWIAEAAHIPVIWATQVLESLAKTGIPSRAEVTDAAMAQRSECVMLNKGPYIVEAVKSLVDILKRMEAHQRKKRSMLRKLQIASLLNQPL
ncbi:pyruvate kinase [Methylacidiphilum caldifontis]|nr:pyruvate kinase [Methylacidiphilum caldifontis]